MNRYAFRALAVSGRLVRGQEQARDVAELTQRLAARQHELLDARLITTISWSLGGDPQRHWQQLCQHMLWLHQAGVPLPVSLQNLADGQGPVAAIAQRRLDALNAGTPLPQLLDDEKNLSSPLRALWQAGCMGDMTQAWHGMHERLLWEISQKQHMRRRLAYPIFLIGLFFCVMLFLWSQVVPQVAGFIEQQGQVPPLATRALVWAGQAMPLLLALVGGGAVVLAAALMAAHHFFQQQVQNFFWTIPVWGRMARHQAWAECLMSLAQLHTHGTDLPQCLAHVVAETRHKGLQEQLMQAEAALRAGQPVDIAVGHYLQLPPLMQQMLSAGVAGNRLPAALQQMADYADGAAKETSERLLRIMEPALTLVVGGVMIWLVAAIIMPLYDQMGALV